MYISDLRQRLNYKKKAISLENVTMDNGLNDTFPFFPSIVQQNYFKCGTGNTGAHTVLNIGGINLFVIFCCSAWGSFTAVCMQFCFNWSQLQRPSHFLVQ